MTSVANTYCWTTKCGARRISIDIVTLNDTAFDIYQEFADKDFQLSDVESFLLQHYEGATAEVVAADVTRLFQEFQQEGLLLS